MVSAYSAEPREQRAALGSSGGWWKWGLPLLILAAALAIRLWSLDLTRFSDDEVVSMAPTAAILDNWQIPATSGANFTAGIRQPPLMVLLPALPAVIRRDPLWISGWIAALNACGALLVYFTGLRLTGSRVEASAAGLLYALNPAAIAYGRMLSWSILFFNALAFFCLIDFWTRRRGASLAGGVLAVLWACQLHPIAIPMAALWAAALLVRWRDVRPGWLTVGVCGGILPLVPYVTMEIQSGWPDLQALTAFSGRAGQTDLQSLVSAALLTGPAIMSHRFFDPEPSSTFGPASWLLVLATVAGLVLGIWRRRSAGVLLACSLLLPILLSVKHSFDVIPNYVLLILPPVAVAQGLSLGGLIQLGRGRRLPRLAPTIVLGGGVLATGLLTADVRAYAGLLSRQQTDPRHAPYIAPLRYSQEAARLAGAAGSDQRVYLAAPNLETTVLPYLSGKPDRWTYAGEKLFVVPTASQWYLAQHDSFSREALNRWFGPPAGTVQTSNGSPAFELFHLPPNAAGIVLRSNDLHPVSADAGGLISLAGYRASGLAAGAHPAVELAWGVTNGPALRQQPVSEFAHLVDGTGKSWSVDTDLWDLVAPWNSGDVVVAPMDLDIRKDVPTGGYWLETGFYETFSQKPLRFREGGQELGNSVRIGPLRIAGVQGTSAGVLGTFGESEISLARADWQGQDVRLEWRADRKPVGDYTVFVHAVDASGTLVGQQDGPPQGGLFPTTIWEAGDAAADVHPLGVAPRPGLHLEIGLYTRPDLRRLPARQAGQPAGDHLTVSPPL